VLSFSSSAPPQAGRCREPAFQASRQTSNHWPPAEVRTLALSILRERYCEFAPSLRQRRWQSITAVRCHARSCAVGRLPMDYGGTVGLVLRRRISRAVGSIAKVNWRRSTARSTPGSRTAGRHARGWLFVDDATSRLMELGSSPRRRRGSICKPHRQPAQR
jgi:hypothetical protein